MPDHALVPLTDLARAWGISARYARMLARAGRIPGAVRHGGPRRGVWLVPADARRPPARKPGRKPRRKED